MIDFSASTVRNEFDRLAALPESWDFNCFYHPHLLSCLPSRLGSLLDVGCGNGAFACLAAPRCEQVTAIDLSPGMIQRALQRPAPPNVQFSVADVFGGSLSSASFDAIVSVAALHHMDIEQALRRFVELLRPGGTLAILDLFSPASAYERLISCLGTVLAPPVRLLKSGRLFRSRVVRTAWSAHEAYDHYLTLPIVESVANALMPGSRVRPHLFWRYSLWWTKAA